MERIRMVICLIILLWNTPVFCSAQGSTQLKVGAERIEVVTRLQAVLSLKSALSE